jgi:excisionase family DNA binding protein
LRNRTGRRAQQWARVREVREQRRQAINDPRLACVKPAALSIQDFALMTGLHRCTVWRRIRDGSLRATKFSGRVLIPYSEIEMGATSHATEIRNGGRRHMSAEDRSYAGACRTRRK